MLCRNTKVNCCYNCEKRVMHCHSTCETYIKQSKEQKEENARISRIKMLNGLANVISYEGVQSVKHGHSSRSNILNAIYR